MGGAETEKSEREVAVRFAGKWLEDGASVQVCGRVCSVQAMQGDGARRT